MFARTLLLFIGLCLGAPLAAAPQIPGAAQKQPVAIIGATVHPADGPAVENGLVVFDGGKILFAGPRGESAIPAGAEVIDAAGKHLYPGLFEARSNIGLVEINAVRATRDESESGSINSNVKANVAVNPDSELIPVTRSNGVLLAVAAPEGGLIAGQAAVMQLDGWTYEDMTLAAGVGMCAAWPRMSGRGGEDPLKRIERVFADAAAYRAARESNPEKQPIDARWEALIPVLAGEMPLIVDADEARQIQSAVAFAQRHKLRLIIYGGYDAEHCAELLKKHDVPVIVAGVHRNPLRRDDDYDAPFTLPERLRAAGVKFCISGAGRFGASNARNLPYHAATAAAFGLSREESLKAITLYPAEILGVSDRAGSLAKEKDATLFIADGDILETETHVEAAWIAGRRVDLSDRHKTLYEKYREKYRRQSDGEENPPAADSE